MREKYIVSEGKLFQYIMSGGAIVVDPMIFSVLQKDVCGNEILSAHKGCKCTDPPS